MIRPPGLDPEVDDDYRRLRTGVGALWLARDAVSVRGPDAEEYLQGQCSQDVAGLAVGAGAPALLLSPQGKLQALVRVTRTAADAFVVDVDGGFGEVVVDRLLRFRLRVKVEIEPLDWRCVALRGPGAPGAGARAAVPDGGLRVAEAWGDGAGIDLLGPAPAVPDGVAECAPEAWAAVRVESGRPRMGAELDERTIAAEAGLVELAVSFTKGCYTGQELVARLDARGNRVARRLRGVVLDGTGPDPDGTVAPGTPVLAGDEAVGAVTSSAWSPGFGATVALAYLHRRVEPPAAVTVAVDGAAPAAGRIGGEARELPLIPPG